MDPGLPIADLAHNVTEAYKRDDNMAEKRNEELA
jgi:hypothetical protein